VLARYFRFAERQTHLRTEVLGGVTTFVTMAYIIVVNPAILTQAGIPAAPSTVATILAAVFGCLLMGLYANRPIAVAPYMGQNAFLALVTVAGAAITVEQRLASVFVSGVLFLVVTLLGLRAWLTRAISPSLKHSFAVGIGLFLLFIGLSSTGVVRSFAVDKPVFVLLGEGPQGEAIERTRQVPPTAVPVPVEIGVLHDPRVLLAIAGFLVMVTLLAYQVRGALLLGMALTAVLGYALGHAEAPAAVFSVPFVGDYSLAAIAFRLDLVGVLQWSFLPLLLTLFLLDLLDTLGTLIGVGAAGGMLDKDGNFPEVEKPMLVDALACMFSALVGTTTSGAYIESAAGVRAGARTGLAAVVTGLLFAACLFFLPLVAPLQKLSYAYGPALIAVGILMMTSVTRIDLNDLTELVPAVVTIVMMVFTYNIGNGLTAGLVLYPVLKVATGRARELSAGAVVLALLSLTYYVFGLPH
jgi:AGZA family xanthine/uracil permease-like MFS transporter